MDKILYYAMNGNGLGCIFVDMPVRNDHRKVWEGEIYGCYSMLVFQLESEGFQLPVLTWKDEPVQLRLSLSVNVQ